MFNFLKDFLKNVTHSMLKIGGFSWALYLAAFLLLSAILDQGKIQARLLNYFKVPMDYLLDLSAAKVLPNEFQLREQIRYYERLAQYALHQPEPPYLLGFCYYYLGDHKKSIEFYKKAVEKAPQSFWTYYNLGVVYFKSGQFEKALSSWRKAKAVDLRETLRFVFASVFFEKRYFGSKENLILAAELNLKEAYDQCQEILMLCDAQNGLSSLRFLERARVLQRDKNFNPKIF
ncbi:MAG: tetratricopeptide repeat protein [Candidatus Omnitrophota bacterium]